MSTIRNTREPYTLESDNGWIKSPTTVVRATLELSIHGHHQLQGLAPRIAWAFFMDKVELGLYEGIPRWPRPGPTHQLRLRRSAGARLMPRYLVHVRESIVRVYDIEAADEDEADDRVTCEGEGNQQHSYGDEFETVCIEEVRGVNA